MVLQQNHDRLVEHSDRELSAAAFPGAGPVRGHAEAQRAEREDADRFSAGAAPVAPSDPERRGTAAVDSVWVRIS